MLCLLEQLHLSEVVPLPVGPDGQAHALAEAIGRLAEPVEQGGEGEVCRFLVGLVVVATLPVVAFAIGGTC